MSKRLDLEKVVAVARAMVSLFETAVEPLQKALEVIPVPTLEEVAEMRRRERPLTPEAYLLGHLHRSLLAAENLASDCRELDLETLGKVHEMELSEVELNEIERAVAEQRSES